MSSKSFKTNSVGSTHLVGLTNLVSLMVILCVVITIWPATPASAGFTPTPLPPTEVAPTDTPVPPTAVLPTSVSPTSESSGKEPKDTPVPTLTPNLVVTPVWLPVTGGAAKATTQIQLVIAVLMAAALLWALAGRVLALGSKDT